MGIETAPGLEQEAVSGIYTAAGLVVPEQVLDLLNVIDPPLHIGVQAEEFFVSAQRVRPT